MEMLSEKIKEFLSVPTHHSNSRKDYTGSGVGSVANIGSSYGISYELYLHLNFINKYTYGCSNDYGIKSFNGHKVYNIDHTPTIITSIHDNIAEGFILRSDFTLTPCFIIKQDNLFAHGETLHKAYEALQRKSFQEYPEEVRIAKFKEQYPDFDKKIPAIELYVWHNWLTGSCELGRKSFAKDHGIDLDKDEFTVNEFIELTKDSYGGEIIEQLK